MNIQDPEIRLALARETFCRAADVLLAEHANRKKRRQRPRTATKKPVRRARKKK
jgi:hypothetical protein